MKALRKPRLRRAIVMMVAIAVSIATVPRSHACQCDAPERAAAGDCCCSQPKPAELARTCCQTEQRTGCCDPGNHDCDCPHCQGEELLKLMALRQSDSLSVGVANADLLVAVVNYDSLDSWHAARLPERPPPDTLSGYCPELERLCRWII